MEKKNLGKLLESYTFTLCFTYKTNKNAWYLCKVKLFLRNIALRKVGVAKAIRLGLNLGPQKPLKCSASLLKSCGKSSLCFLGCPFFASNKKMRNEAKRSKKDAKQNSKLARLSKTKQNKVRMTQFRLHEPLKTILNQKETCIKWASFACFASKRNKRNCLTFGMFLFGLECF
jgi:hypothetical protein